MGIKTALEEKEFCFKRMEEREETRDREAQERWFTFSIKKYAN